MPADHGGRFQRDVLPHLDAAYNLARWLTGDAADADDVVQEALLRAHRFLPGLRADSARAWLLQIVRNSAFALLRNKRGWEELQDGEEEATNEPDAAARLQTAADVAQLREGIASLKEQFREVLVLRELEGLSYEEIASVAQIPLGTVMSRLNRARSMLKVKLLRLERSADAR
jgi:RNA polymerase sigma-70 factor (ECF subfamily)